MIADASLQTQADPASRWAGIQALCVLAALALLMFDVAAGEIDLAVCPGGAQWEAANVAREQALRLPPDTGYSDAALRDELLAMERADQAARNALTPGNAADTGLQQKMLATDAANLARLKQIVDRHGFPASGQVGRAGISAAWIIVQHAVGDPAFQTDMLERMRAYDERDGISRQQLALLEDRVRLAQGKPQVCGSQYTGGFGAPLELRPVQDIAHLDARRARMGMMPSATYRCLLERMNASKP